MERKVFLMAGGGTGGHVIPALAVARELRSRGHEVFFVGTRNGIESRLVPAEDFPIEYIEIGGLKGEGWKKRVITLWQLTSGTLRMTWMLGQRRPAAVFSMGGYVAGPPVISALLRGTPVVVMEPNAIPGITNRGIGRFVRGALVNFPVTADYFPKGRTEITGMPVRGEFFRVPPKAPAGPFTVLITGGSQGSRTLNEAGRASWPMLKQAGLSLRILHQAGKPMCEELQREFALSGLEGEVVSFIADMPAAFAQADLIVSRSGAGAVSELAAAGKPSVLVPFPFAADQHQLKNAEAFAAAGAARLVLDREMNGEVLARLIVELARDRDKLARMGEAARQFARPDAARKAAEILERAASCE